MKTTASFKRGEIISPVPADYIVEQDTLVLSDGCRLRHETGFNATIISRFLIATKDLQMGEEVLVNLNVLFYDVRDEKGFLFSGFKNLAEEEKQEIYIYADENVRQQAIADGFVPNRKESGIDVVRTRNSQLVTVSRGRHEVNNIVFSSTGVLLPFPVRSTVELPGDQHLRLTGGSEFIRHACQPNLRLAIEGDSIHGIALRPIEGGEQLTYNYLCTEWDIAEPFHCACNTDSCYRFIRGFYYLNAEEKALLFPSVTAAIQEKHHAALPQTASLASLEKTTAIAVTLEGKVAAQRYVASGTVLMNVNRFCVRSREVVLDSLHIPHSCDANTALLEGRLVASKPLLSGDPLTLNLCTLFYELPLPFECHCGSSNCARLVKGFSTLSEGDKSGLIPLAERSVLLEAARHGLNVESSSPLVKIRRYPPMGEVTFAADFIPKGTRIFHMRGLVIPFPTVYTVYLGDGNHLLFADGAHCLAHSCDPNTRLSIDASNGTASCFAMRDIEPGEIVSFNYLTSEWDMASPFKCGCGSASCFSTIKGFRHLDEESQLRLWPHATSGVKSLFAQHRRSALPNLDNSLVYLHENLSELRLARDLSSGVVLFTATTFCIAAGEVVLDDVRLKHSCSPTAVFLEGRVVLSRASLRGDAVTLNINHLVYNSPVFACHCGSANCVGEVRGFAGLTDEQKNTEMVYVDPRVRAAAVENGYRIQSSCPLVEVKPNGFMGQATFAKSDIREGTRFFEVSGLVLPFATIYTILLVDEQHLLFADGAQCLAHSCDPNVRIITDNTRKRIGCLALRDIKKGELISFNYLTTEWDMQTPFTCLCGAALCYREIRGFKYLGDEARQKIWCMATPGIKSMVIATKAEDTWAQIASTRFFVSNDGLLHASEDMKDGTVLMKVSCMEIVREFLSLDGIRIRHHCSPNVAVIENRVVVIFPVSAGEEINVDLNCLSYLLLEAFECNCSQFKSPHLIQGFKWLKEEKKHACMIFTEPSVRAAALKDGYKMKCDSSLIKICEGRTGLEAHATANIPAGTRFMTIQGLCLPFSTACTVQLAEGKHLLLFGGAQFLSHSCDANIRFRVDAVNNTIGCEALRDISVEELVSVNYVAVEWDLSAPFHCLCHSPKCLHEIRGFKYLSNAQRLALQGQVTPAIRQLAASHAIVKLPPNVKGNTAGMLQVTSPVTHGTVLVECTDMDIQPTQVSLGGDSYIIRHKEDANTVFVEGRFVTKRNMEEGEFLTVDMNFFIYDTSSLFPLAFAEGCQGFFHLPEVTKQSQLYLCEPSVRAQAMQDGWIVKSSSPLVEVRRNGEMGQTAYAAANIALGEVLFHSTGLVVPFPTMYTICVGDNKHLLFGDAAECIAHHCDPNLQVVVHEENGTFDFVALRSITVGEMLNFNYCTTEWTMNSPFVCLCESVHCAGTIRGFLHLKETDRQRLWPITSPVVKRYASRESY
ncbi:hypothetical protein TCSYLVIO_005710 [Trypanosoma cruzi]|nr:hypothetical protein TCSYLVIO_005710 [Trypanosoma cruzi]